MKFKGNILDIWYFTTLITLIFGFILIIYTVVTDSENRMSSPNGIMYIENLVDGFSWNHQDNVKFVDDLNENQKIFVMTNKGYSFPQISNYVEYKKLSAPIVFLTNSSLGGIELDYKKVFDGYLNDLNWVDIGVSDATLFGKIKLSIVVRTDYEYHLISSYIKEIYPENSDLLIDKIKTYRVLNNGAVNIGFSYRLENEFYQIKSNMPVVEAQFILWKLKDANYTEYEIPNILGFSFVEDFTNINVVDVGNGSVELVEDIFITELAENTSDVVDINENINEDVNEDINEDVNEGVPPFIKTLYIIFVSCMFLAFLVVPIHIFKDT